MITILKYLMIWLFATWFLWVFFLAVMAARTAYENKLLTPVAYRLAMTILFVGWIIDFVVNVTVATVVFLEPPFELTVTARVSRWKKDAGWRGKVAGWICRVLLDPFEVGGHCK